MTPLKEEKCAHPVCSCVTMAGKHCSSECEATAKTPDTSSAMRALPEPWRLWV